MAPPGTHRPLQCLLNVKRKLPHRHSPTDAIAEAKGSDESQRPHVTPSLHKDGKFQGCSEGILSFRLELLKQTYMQGIFIKKGSYLTVDPITF